MKSPKKERIQKTQPPENSRLAKGAKIASAFLEKSCLGHDFAVDSHCTDREPFSLLSLPLFNWSRMAGILYLQNRQRNDITDESMGILSRQVAISLKVAWLYADLQWQIMERRRLEMEILEIRDRERRRIGRDLHDSTGQIFTGITLLSRGLYDKLLEKAPELAATAKEIGDLARQAGSALHELEHDLCAEKLRQRGLVAALEEMAGHVTDTMGISCRLECGDDQFLIPDTATHLYRIAQEAVNNAVKHGHAQNIIIELATGEKSMLRIKDDGIGFFGATPKNQGLGIRTMKYRAEMLQGTLEINSDNGGTVVTCYF